MTISKKKRELLRDISSTSVEIAKCFEIARKIVISQTKFVAQANLKSRILIADSISNLARALDINYLKAKRLQMDQRWKAHVFSLAGLPSGSSLIAAVRAVINATIPFEQTAYALKCPKMILAGILEMGHLPCFRYGLYYNHIRLWKTDTDELVRRLQAGAVDLRADHLQVIRLADLPVATYIHSARRLPRSISQLMDAILTGQAPMLRMARSPETFNDFGLPVEYVRRVLDIRMSIPLERPMLGGQGI